jgi:small subunit ribosomal protein S10
MNGQNIRNRLKRSIIACLIRRPRRVVSTAKATGAQVRGPIPLPSRIEKFTVKPLAARGQEEPRAVRDPLPQRLLDIIEPTPQTVDALMKLDLAAGVDVEIKL